MTDEEHDKLKAPAKEKLPGAEWVVDDLERIGAAVAILVQMISALHRETEQEDAREDLANLEHAARIISGDVANILGALSLTPEEYEAVCSGKVEDPDVAAWYKNWKGFVN